MNKASTRYANSDCLGQSSAVFVLQKFGDVSFKLPKEKFYPNILWWSKCQLEVSQFIK